SVVAEYVRKGMLTEDQARQHLFKSALTRSVGFEEETLVDTFVRPVVKGDVFDHFGFAGLTGDELKAMGYVVWTPVQAPGSWISEGDTSTFMNLIDNGLRGYLHPSYGGWGGRGGPDAGPNPQYASARFFGVAQRDLASRFRWSVTPNYAAANHAPVVRVAGSLDRDVRPGEDVRLTGAASDPDGNALAFRWWQYTDADTYEGTVDIEGVSTPIAHLRVPTDAKAGDTLHLILEVTDNGMPALTRYQRVILAVR
ncbi:MAG: nucleoside hydrolase-like domain-containing protein, partial [Vicinamibacterales bacterium]